MDLAIGESGDFLYAGLNPTLIGLSLVYILTLAKYVKYTLVVGAQAENLVSYVDIQLH